MVFTYQKWPSYEHVICGGTISPTVDMWPVHLCYRDKGTSFPSLAGGLGHPPKNLCLWRFPGIPAPTGSLGYYSRVGFQFYVEWIWLLVKIEMFNTDTQKHQGITFKVHLTYDIFDRVLLWSCNLYAAVLHFWMVPAIAVHILWVKPAFAPPWAVTGNIPISCIVLCVQLI